MTAIVIEFARFVEVRTRRARIAEEFTHPLNEPTVPVRSPEPHDDDNGQVGVAVAADASSARGGVDVC